MCCMSPASLYLNPLCLCLPSKTIYSHTQLRSEYDPRGQLVFRGPRLRIGLCEGVPRTVMPDHVGR